MINTVLDYCKNDPDEIQDFIDELVRQRQTRGCPGSTRRPGYGPGDCCPDAAAG